MASSIIRFIGSGAFGFRFSFFHIGSCTDPASVLFILIRIHLQPLVRDQIFFSVGLYCLDHKLFEIPVIDRILSGIIRRILLTDRLFRNICKIFRAEIRNKSWIGDILRRVQIIFVFRADYFSVLKDVVIEADRNFLIRLIVRICAALSSGCSKISQCIAGIRRFAENKSCIDRFVISLFILKAQASVQYDD